MHEQESSPKQPELLADHPIFYRVFELQRTLEEARFIKPITAYKAGMELLQPLMHEAQEAGLLGQPVALTGLAIVMPDTTHDPVTGMESIEPTFVDAHDELGTSTNDSEVSSAPVIGDFYGFHPAAVLDKPESYIDESGEQVFATTVDGEQTDDEPFGYRIVIHYRVAISDLIQMGNIVGRLCAEGNISCTTLEFREDKRLKDSEKALLDLGDETIDEQTAQVSAEINDLLTATDDSSIYDHQRLTRLGQSIRNHEANKGINKRYRDAVLSLAEARLGIYPGDIFNVSAPDGIAKIKGAYTIVRSKFTGLYEVLGLEFSPHYHIHNDQGVITEGAETLSLVVKITIDKDEESADDSEEDDEDDQDNFAYCYVPFDKLTELAPVDL